MIEIERRGSLALLTLAHGKANALDVELCQALIARLDECRQPWCNRIVITGRGSIFSAGVDLLRVVNEGAPYVARFLPVLSDALEAAFAMPKPVIAAVNGHAIAGGCILACAADRRLMARGTARIGVPELLVGVPFPRVPLEIIRFAVAPLYVPELVYGGATHLPDAAFAHSLVDAVVEPDALLDEALKAAAELAGRGEAFTLTKRLLREPSLERMRAGRQRSDAEVERVWASDKTLTGIRSYIERTFKKG